MEANDDTDEYAHADSVDVDRKLHVPVMVNECLNMLAPAIDAEGAILIDATLGLGGHTEAALKRFPGLHVIGIDRDPEAIARASRRLEPFTGRFTTVQTTYDHIDEVAESYGQDALVDGILMDLGVSSLQLDEAQRGFSYSQDAPLDMRMDPTSGRSAAELLATSDEREITRILRAYGEERFASRIARLIVEERQSSPVTRTAQLVDLVRRAIPAAARRTGGNPCKRTFQALRVAVNDELRILETALPKALGCLRVGGRLVIESYQSLEDRMVKRIFREGSEDHTPADLPILESQKHADLKLLGRGAQLADDAEREKNPRSASVRLRGAEIVNPWRRKQ